MENTNEYYLFGEDAVEIFDSEGFDALYKTKNKVSYAVECFNKSTPISNILYAALGWNSFENITEEQYNLLK